MEGEGMVAVVRGLQGSGLAVTLLDSGRQFTLLPENYSHPAPRVTGDGRRCYGTASQCASNIARRESGVQATDGRYTSTYKMMHCHHTPTSPPDEVTEFPPQRPEICPGHGNFIIGGQGSGESHCYPTKSSEYRGAMCWPDRGSVFSPRPSLQPDSFATSLRKYPNVSQDRSSEIVERLINFTQAKNACKNRNASPTRNIESNMSNQTFCVDAKSSRNTSTEKLKRGYQPDVVIRPKRCDESPTREIFRQNSAEVEAMESYRRPTFCKTNDVRYLRDVSRKVRESMRSLSPPLDNRPERLNPRERHNSANGQRRALPQWSTDTVNMEIQATVQVTTREIMTSPRIVPPQRTIAVPLTPSTSMTDEKLKEIESDKLASNREESTHQIEQVIKTKLSLVDIQVQTVSSAIDFSNRKRHRKKPKIRSQSEERLQIIELLKYRRGSGLKQSLKSRSFRSHDKGKSREVFVELVNKFESKMFSTDVLGNKRYAERYCPTFARIFRADVAQYKTVDDEGLKDILRDWINLIPLKATNKFENYKERKYIQYDFFNYLKRFVNIPPEHVRTDKLKADILNRLNLIPLQSKSDKSLVVNKLADILIDKITHIGRKRWDIDISKNTHYDTHFKSSMVKGTKLPCDNEIEKFVLKYTTAILQNSDVNIPEVVIKDIEEELEDILIEYFKRENIDDNILKDDIVRMLYDYGISNGQAYSFAQIFMKKFKEILGNNIKSHRVRSNALIILPSACCHRVNKESDALKTITDEDISENLKQYTNELCQQINEWLNDLRIEIPESVDKDSKLEAIRDLSNDIIERHKYLELNPCNEINEEIEIEHLKYQVFKWIKKIVSEDNLEPVQRAHDLMNRLKRIPIPILTKQQGSCGNTSVRKQDFSNEMPQAILDNDEVGITKQTKSVNILSDANNENYEQNKGTANNDTQNKSKCNMNVTCTSNSKSCCQNQMENSNVLKDFKDNNQLEEEYEQFVQSWVKKIPMNVADFEDESVLEKARMGIYNGLWKVVSKLNCDPATYFNRFLYEDLLDDAIDDLLDCLPQSIDLTSKRHLLKVELIEKTISINDKIKENEERSFKNKLMQNVVTDLRKKGIPDSSNQNSTKLLEDLQVAKLVEDYLLLTKFKNEDKVISEIYKVKLLKEVDDFIKDLKKNHTTEFEDLDVATYQTDLIAILDKVPLPSENTLNQEVDEVLLGLEIEEWYQDLPIVSNNDNEVLYQRRKQRDILVKKIKEIESKNVTGSSESALRSEVSKFLEKVPLREGESLNINFMVDELVNRLKNKTKNDQSSSIKKVYFESLNSYDQFRKDVPLCSSLIELPKASKSQIMQPHSAQGIQVDDKRTVHKMFEQQTNTTRIQFRNDNDPNFSRRQTRVVIQEPPTFGTFAERPHSSSFKESSNDQWFSLLTSHPDVGTQTKNTNAITIQPHIDTETTQSNNKGYAKTKDIPVKQKPSDNEHWLSLQRSRPDVGTQTPDVNINKQPPYVGDNKGAVTLQSNEKENIKLKDIPKCCQQLQGKQDLHIKVEANSTKGPSRETASQTQIDIKAYQFKKEDKHHLKDISEVEEGDNQIFIKQEDVSSVKCSVECQTDSKAEYTNLDTQHSLQDEINKDASKGISSTVDKAKIKVTLGTENQTPVLNEQRTRDVKVSEARGKLAYDSDEDIPCRCIDRYMKQAPKRYPCEAFDRLPYVPVFYPYPYFI